MTNENLSMNQKVNNEYRPYMNLEKLLAEEYGLMIRVNKKKEFRFPVYLSDKLKDISVESLELSPRSSNCLKRADIKTLYDIYTKISSKSDLTKIRNCGDRSACEIMEQIFLYQYNNLSEKRREKFILHMIELNK